MNDHTTSAKAAITLDVLLTGSKTPLCFIRYDYALG